MGTPSAVGHTPWLTPRPAQTHANAGHSDDNAKRDRTSVTPHHAGNLRLTVRRRPTTALSLAWVPVARVTAGSTMRPPASRPRPNLPRPKRPAAARLRSWHHRAERSGLQRSRSP